MVATSGARLLPLQAIRSLKEELLPLTTILTPNIPEALLLLKGQDVTCEEPRNIEDLIQIAEAVQKLGPGYVLLKGGHFAMDDAKA